MHGTLRNKMTPLDKMYYNHFYDTLHKKFVYSIENCEKCIGDRISGKCPYCEESERRRLQQQYGDYFSQSFLVAEYQWLYGGIYSI